MSDSQLVQISKKQGNRGAALKSKTTLSVIGQVVSLGQTPREGTSCTAYLSTNGDTAYNNLLVQFICFSFGREIVFNSTVITAAQNASSNTVALTVSGCAADFWEVRITLQNGALPALPLESNLVAFGRENVGTFQGGTITNSTIVNPTVNGLVTTSNSVVNAASGSNSPPAVTSTGSDSYVNSFTAAARLSAGLALTAISFLPLPGNILSPVATGTMWVDVIATFKGSGVATGAVIKASIGYAVQVSGSPVLLGTGQITSLSVGTNAGAPPAGYQLVLGLDAGSTNVTISVAGDSAVASDCLFQVEWRYVR